LRRGPRLGTERASIASPPTAAFVRRAMIRSSRSHMAKQLRRADLRDNHRVKGKLEKNFYIYCFTQIG
jgi:hypothetical protein